MSHIDRTSTLSPLTYLLTYLLTPWCRVFLEKLTVLQLVKKFPAFHGTRRFITALTSACHLSLSSASPIQSIYPHPTSWRSILILSTHLRLGLPIGLFSSSFPTKTLYIPTSALAKYWYTSQNIKLYFFHLHGSVLFARNIYCLFNTHPFNRHGNPHDEETIPINIHSHNPLFTRESFVIVNMYRYCVYYTDREVP